MKGIPDVYIHPSDEEGMIILQLVSKTARRMPGVIYDEDGLIICSERDASVILNSLIALGCMIDRKVSDVDA